MFCLGNLFWSYCRCKHSYWHLPCHGRSQKHKTEKKKKITKGENYKRRPGVQNFYGLKMVFDEPTFTFYPSLQKVKPLSLYVLYSLKSEMKLALSPRSFPASQRNEYIPCKVLKAKSKRICDLVTIQCRSFYRVKRKSDAWHLILSFVPFMILFKPTKIKIGKKDAAAASIRASSSPLAFTLTFDIWHLTFEEQKWIIEV